MGHCLLDNSAAALWAEVITAPDAAAAVRLEASVATLAPERDGRAGTRFLVIWDCSPARGGRRPVAHHAARRRFRCGARPRGRGGPGAPPPRPGGASRPYGLIMTMSSFPSPPDTSGTPQQSHTYPGADGPVGRRWGRRTVLIVAVSVVGLLAAGFGVRWMASGPDEYRLSMPDTLLSGSYQRSEDGPPSSEDDAPMGPSGTAAGKPIRVTARYEKGSAGTREVLMVTGAYGRFTTPHNRSRTALLSGASAPTEVQAPVPPKDITPPGSDITVSCQVLTRPGDEDVRVDMPMCAWSDRNTMALVVLVIPDGPQPAPESIDLDGLAAMTLQVRSEARQPAG